MPVYDFFLQNWRVRPRLETAWSTDIVRSATTLREDRRSLVKRPYRAMTLQWTGVNQAEVNRLVMALARAADQRILVPVYPDVSVTTATSSNTTINCPTANRRFHVGGQVVIFSFDGEGRPTNAQIRTITVIGGASLTISAALTGSYAAGAVVYPLMLCEIMLENDLRLLSTARSELEMTVTEVSHTQTIPARVEPGNANAGPLGTQTSDVNTNGGTQPILNLSPNFGQEVRAGVVRAGARYDQGYTQVVSVAGARAFFTFSLSKLFDTRAKAFELLQFFDSRRGRLLPFWLLSPALLYSLQLIAAGFLEITPVGNIEDLQEYLEYVAVVHNDGTIYIRKVSSVAVSGGNWRINLATNLPVLSVNDMAKVTQAHFGRFASDAIEESWATSEVCEMRFGFTEVHDEGTDTNLGALNTGCIPA